jgi:hypothetical protein
MPWNSFKNAQVQKANSRTFIHKFVTGFVDKGLGFPWQPPINKNYETQ